MKSLKVQATVAVAAAASLLLAACSSNGDGGKASEGAKSSCVTEAQGALKAAQEEATLKVTPKKLDASGASGKTVYLIIPAAVTFWNDASAGLKEAASAVGMKARTLNANASLPNLTAAFSQALAAGADGIIVGAFPPAAYANQLAEAKKAGIPVISSMESTPGSPHVDGVSTLIGVDFPNLGKVLAAQMLNETSCKLSALVPYAAGQPQLKSVVKAITSTTKDLCGSACGVEGVTFPGAQAATAVGPLAVSRYNANPKINYFVSNSSNLGPLIETSLKQAQIDVPLTGIGGQQPDLETIVEGGLMNSNNIYAPGKFVGWTFADAFVRAFAGQSPEDVTLPTRLVTAETLKSSGLEPADIWPGYQDFAASFKAAWSVS